MDFKPGLRLLDLLDGHDEAPALIEGSMRLNRADLRQAALRAAHPGLFGLEQVTP